MSKRSKRSSIIEKTKKIVKTDKELRRANFHFCEDVIESSTDMKEKILEKKADRKMPKLPKKWENLLDEVISYISYVKLEMKQLKSTTVKGKEKIKDVLSNKKKEI